MADHVAVLNAGRIDQVDTPKRLYADPATPFVHEFLGESVRLACMIQGGQARIESLPSVSIPTVWPPGPGFALIRPHEIGLLPGPGPARVVSVHVTGPLTRVHLRLGEQDVDVLRQLDAWTPAVGETCDLDLSRARIYPLDGTSRFSPQSGAARRCVAPSAD